MYGQQDPDKVADMTVSESDLNWNTHRQLKEKFGYPQDAEFFLYWLEWFYELGKETRTYLRQAPLEEIDITAYPPTPTFNQETS